ncbi:MAG: chlorite dismutase family protein [Actinomycetota bacterium]|nr:chlorite dismutase family protein [Actinomycetota bacterium]
MAREAGVTALLLMGLRSDAGFMLWRIGYDLEAFESMQGALTKTGLGESALLDRDLSVTGDSDGEFSETSSNTRCQNGKWTCI